MIWGLYFVSREGINRNVCFYVYYRNCRSTTDMLLRIDYIISFDNFKINIELPLYENDFEI